MDADQKFSVFIDEWAARRNCTFITESFDGRECPDLIDGMAIDDVWGWLIPDGKKQSDEFYGMISWDVSQGNLLLTWIPN